MEDEYEDLDHQPEGEEEAAAPTAEELREQIRQEERARLEEEFQQHKASLNSGIKQRLKDVAGIELTDEGDLRPVDPIRATQFAARAQVQEPEPEPEVIPDPTYDPDGFRKWHQQAVRREAEALVAPMRDEFRQQLEQVGGWAMRPQLAGIGETARASLATVPGLDALADDPEYLQELTQTVQTAIRNGQLPADALADPAKLAPAAWMVASQFGSKLQQQPRRERSETGQFLPSDVSRAGLRTMQPSRGTGPVRGGGPQVSDADRFGMELTGIQDPKAWSMLDADSDPDAYVRYRQAQAAKQRGR